MAPLTDDDLIGTISDNDIISDGAEEASIAQPTKKRKRETIKQSPVKKQHLGADEGSEAKEDSDIDSGFEFGLENGTTELDDWEALIGEGTWSAKRAVDVDALAVKRGYHLLQKEGEGAGTVEDYEGSEEGLDGESDRSFDGFGGGADMADGSDVSQIDDEEERALLSDNGTRSPQEKEIADPMPNPDDRASASESDSDAIEDEKSKAFFAPEVKTQLTRHATFQSLSLFRPIMKGLAALNFNHPTPIQAKAIPVALAGKDVVGGAVTGSGKTAAFILPILERLMFRPKRPAVTRVAILTPTRELALQCFQVAKKLAQFTDITFGQAIGGLNVREQEKALKQRPDIVIGTPGRFIDLERNTTALDVQRVEILVLDEADRMLEEGFSAELNEILTKIPKSRQTMLFSATMTSKVDDLIRAGLRQPVRLVINPQTSTVQGLVQEFVRLRPGREGKRLGYLLHLCTSVHSDRCIIFFRQKKEVHRTRVLFALCGLKAAELHGAMTQEQRIQAMASFRTGKASFLLATDLASRGLDIQGIETVINYEAPQNHEIYVHRVGRTARAGRTGRACTIAAEADRKVVKVAVKSAKKQGASIVARSVPGPDADAWQEKIDGLQSEVESILQEEKEERALQTTERDLKKADNMVEHREEIMSRPRKTWFESDSQKQEGKVKGAELLNGRVEGGGAKKGRKLSNKQKKKLQDKDDRRDGKVWRGKSAAEKGKGKAKKGR